MLAESLPNAPVLLTVHLQRGWERSPTISILADGNP